MEYFIYSQDVETVRRRTLSLGQKGIAVASMVLATALTMFLVDSGTLKSPMLLVPAVIGIMLLPFVVLVLLALSPKGPEKDFELPSLKNLEEVDWSFVRGSVRLTNGETREVEVKVPTVHSGPSVNLLSAMPDMASSGISTPEMFEMALERIQKQYPGCAWREEPEVRQ